MLAMRGRLQNHPKESRGLSSAVATWHAGARSTRRATRTSFSRSRTPGDEGEGAAAQGRLGLLPVYFRELNHSTGKRAQTSLSWNNPNDAERCRTLIDQIRLEKAREILRSVQTPGQVQTVRQFPLRYLDPPHRNRARHPCRYRAYVRNEIGPVLGEIPLTALSRDDAASRRAQPRPVLALPSRPSDPAVAPTGRQAISPRSARRTRQFAALPRLRSQIDRSSPLDERVANPKGRPFPVCPASGWPQK